jgi:hypothetical protein
VILPTIHAWCIPLQVLHRLGDGVAGLDMSGWMEGLCAGGCRSEFRGAGGIPAVVKLGILFCSEVRVSWVAASGWVCGGEQS